MRSKARREMHCAGHEVRKSTRIIVLISTTRAAILMRRRRKPPNWATRPIKRFGIGTRNPVRAGVEEEAEPIGGGFRAGCAVRRQMRLPVFDAIFGLVAPSTDIFAERASIALLSKYKSIVSELRGPHRRV